MGARTGGHVVVGIGDDCSVLSLPKNHELLVTTDFCLEGVHFRREWHSAESIGHRCLTRGLSDIAAMGGTPLAAFLSLALPPKTPQRWIDGFLRGLLALAKKYKTTLAGGDTAQSPAGILADIIVTGSVPQGTAVLRSGARAGDRIYVSGELGSAAAEIDRLYSSASKRKSSIPLPQPRVNLGRVLRERGIATSMIDISDGLSTDLHHLCSESRVGAEIWRDAVPRGTYSRGTPVDLQFALHGGDAYELLFTAAKNAQVPSRIDGVAVTEIGCMTSSRQIELLHGARREPFKPQGWQHFGRE